MHDPSHETCQTILLVEDCPEDYQTILRNFKQAGVTNPIHHCQDGDDALDYLFQRGRYAEGAAASRPAVILLDLTLPGTDSLEVLTQIKQASFLRNIPVIALTCSRDERDLHTCCNDGANGCIKKPVDLNGLLKAIGKLPDCRFQIVLLPEKDAA